MDKKSSFFKREKSEDKASENTNTCSAPLRMTSYISEGTEWMKPQSEVSEPPHKQRLYISLPITGHETTAPIKASEMKVELQGKGFDVITPYDVSCLKDMPDNFYLGQDITAMLTCDVVYFCRGWQDSNGCNVEFFTAKQYKKQLQFE